MPRHSAGSVGTYDRTVVHTYVRYALIVFITNDTALCMFEHISHIQNSIAYREFPVSIQVQGCGETDLYTLYYKGQVTQLHCGLKALYQHIVAKNRSHDV